MDYTKEAIAVLTEYNAARRLQGKGPQVPYTALEAQVLAAVMAQSEARGITGFCYMGDDDYQASFITCFYGDIMLRVDMSTVYKYTAKRDDPDSWTTVEIDFHNGDPYDYVLVAQLKVCSDGEVVPHEKGWQLIKLAIPNGGK